MGFGHQDRNPSHPVAVDSRHKIGHSGEMMVKNDKEKQLVNEVNNEVIWCARRDSNSRPNAPEAFALSS